MHSANDYRYGALNQNRFLADTVKDAPVQLTEEFDAEKSQFGSGVVAASTADIDMLDDPRTVPRSMTASAPRSEFAADKEVLAAMTPEERIERIRESVERSPKQREILYETLVFCQEPCSYESVESHIAGHRAWTPALQAPRILVDIMVRAGGIDVEELDEEGEVVTEERKDEAAKRVRAEMAESEADEDEVEAAVEDALDDLVRDWRLATSEAGRGFLSEYSAENRLRTLLQRVPAQRGVYCKILDGCRNKRTLQEVCGLFERDELPRVSDSPNSLRVQPSTFVTRLEAAGGLVWEGGWLTTEDGKRCLESIEVDSEDEKDDVKKEDR